MQFPIKVTHAVFVVSAYEIHFERETRPGRGENYWTWIIKVDGEELDRGSGFDLPGGLDETIATSMINNFIFENYKKAYKMNTDITVRLQAYALFRKEVDGKLWHATETFEGSIEEVDSWLATKSLVEYADEVGFSSCSVVCRQIKYRGGLQREMKGFDFGIE